MNNSRVHPIVQRMWIGIPTVLACLWLIKKGYSIPWTGFGESTNAKNDDIPAKTLWDWLVLLLVPLLLALVAWWLDDSRKASELRVETDRQRQKTLDDYLECMTQMLVQNKLFGQESEVARSIARTRT